MSKIDLLMTDIRKKAKKAQRKRGKKRTAKKSNRNSTAFLSLKKQFDEKNFRLQKGALQRKYIQAIVHMNHCKTCKEVSPSLYKLEVWSQSTVKKETWQMTCLIQSHGQLQFNSDLPIKISEITKFVPLCMNCLVHHKNLTENHYENN